MRYYDYSDSQVEPEEELYNNAANRGQSKPQYNFQDPDYRKRYAYRGGAPTTIHIKIDNSWISNLLDISLIAVRHLIRRNVFNPKDILSILNRYNMSQSNCCVCGTSLKKDELLPS